MSDRRGRRGGDGGDRAPDFDDEDDPDMGDLFDELAELEDSVDSDDERERVRETMQMAMEVQDSEVFGRVVFGFDRSDAAEALLGSLLFGIPMFVEGGTTEVGEFIAGRPHYLLLTNALTITLAIGILYVADFQDVRVHNPILGVVPRKLAGVLTIPLVTAVVVMTAWGRVDWANPELAVCQISVALVPMAIGAALGDLLPG
ncbi:DUF2391 family protein [Halosimplex pelagicum]|uniref:DUF2391 family protein n=1 Tax=Halosimplex pelagicum TaxID=869886 RepID=A0A7D5TBQ4_9EURY|nr:DUF2391 family protein [Halosimplex pelagicum]QLH83930.1 DUF2391 family protein [Halosimplex pelagicum]